VAVTIANTESALDEISERYINGEVEEIYSKLAVEPVLRTYLLSLIATGFVNTEQEILSFFSKTFWAHQFQDMERLGAIIEKMLLLLDEWEFIRYQKDDFISAASIKDGPQQGNERIEATLLGKKVAELYIDPLTARDFVLALRKSGSIEPIDISFLQMISNTLEIRPLLKVKTKEWDDFQERLAKYQDKLLIDEPSLYEDNYDTCL
jgi:helicase